MEAANPVQESLIVKKVASVTWEQIRAIAEDKMPDLNAFT
jgi:ribosomal protein L11